MLLGLRQIKKCTCNDTNDLFFEMPGNTVSKQFTDTHTRNFAVLYLGFINHVSLWATWMWSLWQPFQLNSTMLQYCMCLLSLACKIRKSLTEKSLVKKSPMLHLWANFCWTVVDKDFWVYSSIMLFKILHCINSWRLISSLFWLFCISQRPWVKKKQSKLVLLKCIF